MIHGYELLRKIHLRFERNFKNYRIAFRRFDVNFDGTVEFDEFINGLEICGIVMSMADFRLVWDIINYDQESYIDFSKFCLINVDKSENIIDLIKNTILNKKQHQ